MPSSDDWDGIDLEQVTDRAKDKILRKFNFFARYVLPDMILRDKELAEELWDRAVNDPKAADDLRYHIHRLKGNGKL